jgi:hypothetical protein
MPNVMGREFPYTPEGMAAAEQYKQSVGMRDGGSMGFRPVGYANGSPGVAVGDEDMKMAAIQEIMKITGMTDPGPLLEMSMAELTNALSGLLGNEQGMPSTEQGMMPPGQMMAPPPEQMMAPPSEMGAGNMTQPGGLPPINSQDYMPGNMAPSPQPNVGDQIGGGYRNGGLASLRRY